MLAAGCLLVTTAPALAAPACPASRPLSRLVAASETIIVGQFETTSKAVGLAAQAKSPSYMNLMVKNAIPLKGAPPDRPVVAVYPQDAPSRPSLAALRTAAIEPSLMFLTWVDDFKGLYFAGYTPDALRPAAPALVAATRVELARQDAILRYWKADPRLPDYAQAHRLIQQLAHLPKTANSADAQQRIFDQIEALGPRAVPAIIAQMDDRRPLAVKAIALTNKSPDAFEGRRFYSPDLVVDALAALLNQITGEGFGNIESGGSDRTRRATVDGWRIHAHDLACVPPR